MHMTDWKDKKKYVTANCFIVYPSYKYQDPSSPSGSWEIEIRKGITLSIKTTNL